MSFPVIVKFVFILLNLSVTFVFGDGPKIVVVGAGAAGLAAVQVLLENGIDNVVILEAENRTGGRIFPTKFGDYTVDLGIKFNNNEKIKRLYNRWPFEILETSQRARDGLKFYTSSGDKPLTNEQSKEIINFYFNFDGFDEISTNTTMGSLYTEALMKNFESDDKIFKYLHSFLHLFEMYKLTQYPALSWSELAPIKKQILNVNSNKTDKNISRIFDLIMQALYDSENKSRLMNLVKLNTEVEQINYENSKEKIKIHAKNRRVYEADYVIMTPSLGVMKFTHGTLFNPNLPEDKQNFINKFGYGSMTKIYLLFQDSWWLKNNENFFGFNLLWTEEDWQEREHNSDKEWELYVTGFFNVENKSNVLSMWLASKGAQQIEKIPENELIDQITELLQIFKKDFNVSRLLKIIRSDWFSNHHFHGTSSYYSYDYCTCNSSESSITDPIFISHKPKILFAGEATEPVWYSTIYGAVASGIREAQRILNSIQN